MASPKDDSQGSVGSKRFRNDASRRDGDWTCPKCGNLNFSFRTVCYQGRCSAPRPAGPPLTPFTSITSPYRNTYPFYYGGFAVPPSYGMSSQFQSLVPHSGTQYDYGLYARPRALYSPLPMFPPGNFQAIAYGSRPKINGYVYGFQNTPWTEGFVPDNFASRKRRGGPDGLSEGDWICPNCDNVNFAFRTTCNMKHCGAARPLISNQPTTMVIPEGSWTCKRCSNLNYPFRNVCNRRDCRMRKQYLHSDISMHCI